MTTNEIEEIVKFRKYLDNHINYFVSDPNDPRVAILARDVIEGVFRSCLLKYGEKCREEERERIKDLFDEYNEMDDNAIQFELRIRKVADFMKKFNSNH